MSKLYALSIRNIKLFFKDRTLFLVALVTPLILLLLYATFLANAFKMTFTQALPPSIMVSKQLVNSFVAGQLFASIIAVSCITVAFSSNSLMVQDKVTEAYRDLTMAPVKSSTISLSYFISSLISTMLIALVAFIACLIYVFFVGWYFSLSDIFFLLLDIIILVFFGTALSSVVNFFLTTEGQISAVTGVISAAYGFICGAYMPISQFSPSIQKAIMFFPGVYGTSLIRMHTLGGVMNELQETGVPIEVVTNLKDMFDLNLYFYNHNVLTYVKYIIMIATIIILIGIYLVLNLFKTKKHK